MKAEKTQHGANCAGCLMLSFVERAEAAEKALDAMQRHYLAGGEPLRELTSRPGEDR